MVAMKCTFGGWMLELYTRLFGHFVFLKPVAVGIHVI